MKQTVIDRIDSLIDKWIEKGEEFKDDMLDADNEEEWSRLRTAFFEIEKYTCVSVNAANLCPSLKPVVEMGALVDDILGEDISFPARAELANASLGRGLDEIRDWIGLQSSHGENADPQHFAALTRNASEGNNIINNDLIATGFFDPKIHNVVLWDVNHPTNLDAWEFRQAAFWEKLGISQDNDSLRIIHHNMFSQSGSNESYNGEKLIPSDPQSYSDILNPILAKIDGNTRVLSLSWQSNECGMLLPMSKIVKEIRLQYGDQIHIHADSAQTLGVIPLDLDNTNVDSITASLHKWPCGPKMVGLLSCRESIRAANRFNPGIWGYDEYIKTPADYTFEADTGKIDTSSKRFGYLGQQNDATLVSAWMTALFHNGKLHPNVTPAKIAARIDYLGSRVKDALYRRLGSVFPDFTEAPYKYILTPTTNDTYRSSIFLFKVPVDSKGREISAGDVMINVYNDFEKYPSFAIANLKVNGHNVVRIAPTIFNGVDEIEKVVNKTVDVMINMLKGELPNHKHLRSYA